MAALECFEAIWGSRYLEIYISVASMALALWMGLYILRRGAGTPVGLLGGATLLLLSAVYGLEAMLDAPGITVDEYEMLLRTQGLVVPWPIAIWVSLAFMIRSERRITTIVKWVWLIVGMIGASQAWLRAFTNWHYDYAHISPSSYPFQDWWQPPGQGYAASTVLALAALIWSSYNTFRPFYDEVGSLRAILRMRQFWPLFSGISIFAISIAYMMAVYALGIGAPGVIGLGVVTVGVAALGFGVYWHNTFVEDGRDITTDFLYSIAGIGAVLALHALVIFLLDGFDRWGVGPVVVMVAALVITHSLHDIACLLFDRFLERVGLSRWTMGHRLCREMLLRAQREGESRDALKERLAALLTELCQEVSTNRGYVALRDGHDFVVHATHGVRLQSPKIASPELECENIIRVPHERQLGVFKGVGLIVPLRARGQQVGVVALGEKRYDDGEVNRILVCVEAMQLAIEALEVGDENGKLQRKLAQFCRQRQGAVSGEDKYLLSLCAKSGLSFKNVAEAVAAATEMLQDYREDPYALEVNPFSRCSRVQAHVARSSERSQAPIHYNQSSVSSDKSQNCVVRPSNHCRMGRSDHGIPIDRETPQSGGLGEAEGEVAAILEAEIASTIASMKPSHQQGQDWRQWTYLNRRYIDKYDEDGHRFSVDDIARFTGVSRKTLARGHAKAIRSFLLAFLDPGRASAFR